MRNLNSILIEGLVLDSHTLASLAGPDGLPCCTFSLASGSDAPSIPVIAYSRLAARCSELLSEGSSVRVVGRIAQDLEASAAAGSFRLHVIAEHVEIQPARSKPVLVETADANF